MNIEDRINELETKIDSNMDKIIKNMNRLHKHEEAETPQQKQMLNETLQRSMR